MLVKLQTTDYLIYAELNKTERITHLASKDWIPARTCYTILHEIERRADFQITWGLADDGYSILFGSRGRVDCVYFIYHEVFVIRKSELQF